MSPDNMVLAAGYSASVLLGCSPQGLKAKRPSKSLQHQDPIGEEGWEVLLNTYLLRKALHFLHSPVKLRTTFNLKKATTQELVVSLVQPGPSSLPRCWICGSTWGSSPWCSYTASSQMGTSDVAVVSVAHPGSWAVIVSTYTKTDISILWHRKPPGQLFTWTEISIYFFRSALLITETFINKIQTFSVM